MIIIIVKKNRELEIKIEKEKEGGRRGEWRREWVPEASRAWRKHIQCNLAVVHRQWEDECEERLWRSNSLVLPWERAKKSEWMCLCLTEQLGLEWKKTMQQQTAEDKRERRKVDLTARERESERKWWLLRENEEERNKQKRRRLKSSGAETAKQQQQQLQHYLCHFSSPSLLLFSSLLSVLSLWLWRCTLSLSLN